MIIELIEAARSGTAAYEALYERRGKAIAKVVLSQIMTTEDGASRAQAEVPKGVADWVVKSDTDRGRAGIFSLAQRWSRIKVAWCHPHVYSISAVCGLRSAVCGLRSAAECMTAPRHR